ncbi:MAG: capsule assembly Wzi family protein [Polymorphobacter sp.]
MRFAVTIAALLLVGTAPAVADPFAQISDRRFRQDIVTMKAAGLIIGPIESWPMTWAQIDKGLDNARDGRALPPHLRAAVARVEALSALAHQTAVFELRANATNGAAVARDFNGTAREDFDGAAKVDLTWGNFSANIGIRYAPGQRGNDYDFSPSQVAAVWGNWGWYAGYTALWTGPGEDGALLYSNSARPMPKIGFKRLVPYTIDAPVLKWLGPLNFEMFLAIQNEPRDYRNAAVIGTRLSFEPFVGLTFGFNRMQQLCGQGRPCSFSTILDSFIGAGSADNAASTEEAFFAQPGNQIAGFDISYTRQFGKVTGKFYAEAEAEDADNIILEQYMRMIGMMWSGPLGSEGASWQAGIEYSDTLASQLFAGTFLGSALGNTTYPTSAYNNQLYYSGFTYNVKPVGYWTDGDSNNLALSGAITDAQNRRWYGSLRFTNINTSNLGNPGQPIIYPDPPSREGEIAYRISANAESINFLTGGVLWPTRIGDISLEGRYQSDSPNTPGYADRQAQIEVGYLARF